MLISNELFSGHIGAMLCGMGLYSPGRTALAGSALKEGGAGGAALFFEPTNALTANWAMAKMATAWMMFLMVDYTHVSHARIDSKLESIVPYTGCSLWLAGWSASRCSSFRHG